MEDCIPKVKGPAATSQKATTPEPVTFASAIVLQLHAYATAHWSKTPVCLPRLFRGKGLPQNYLSMVLEPLPSWQDGQLWPLHIMMTRELVGCKTLEVKHDQVHGTVA